MFKIISTSMTDEIDNSKTKLNSSFDIDFYALNLATNPYLEHRLKILTISNTSLKPGIKKTIPTNLINSQKYIPNNFQLQLKSSNKLPINLVTEKVEIIEDRLFVDILNYNNFPLKICSKSPIAYLFIQPSN